MSSLVPYEEWVKMGQHIALKDGKVFYVRKGRGIPLIMTHSYGGNSWWFCKIMDGFAEHFNVYALDLPGSAQSDTPTLQYGPEGYADVLEEFMDTLGIQKAHLLSNHGSGFSVAHFAITRPERVDKLVLDCMPYWTREEGHQVWERVRTQWLDENGHAKPFKEWGGMGVRFPHLPPEERQIATDRTGQDMEEHSEWWANLLWAELDYEINDRLDQIQAPTLLINGEDDWHRKGEERVRAGIPGANLVVIPNAGGSPAFEQPNLYSKTVLNFLRGSLN